MTNNYQRYIVLVHDFKHDSNGNAIAHHTVYAYRSKAQHFNSPSDTPYETKRRQQVGYSDRRDDWARTALDKAGAPTRLTLVSSTGDRSEGLVRLIYDVPGSIVECPAPGSTFVAWGLTFKTQAFATDEEANAFMTKNPGWGLIGIEENEGLRHVAHKDDTGTK